MKKKLIYGLLPIVILTVIIYLLSTYTHTGRVWSLYVLGAPLTPPSVKYECIKKTNQEVHDKFQQPLNFTEDAKRDLKEYWHFSYYRHCLFEAGYDFLGRRITASELTDLNGSNRYTNHVAGVTFNLPANSIVQADNINDPEVEDRRITSLLKINEGILILNTYRSYDDMEDLTIISDRFQHFATSTGLVTHKKLITTNNGIELLEISQDDDLSGLLGITPDKKVFEIFGYDLDSLLLKRIKDSIHFTE